MNFIPTPDNEAYFEHIISEDCRIEIGIYPVMFGYRVRAGFIGNQWSEIDWCGGNDQAQVEMLYSIAKNILETQGNFKDMPMCSQVKPFYKDQEFLLQIESMVKKPLDIVKLKPLQFYKDEMMKGLF